MSDHLSVVFHRHGLFLIDVCTTCFERLPVLRDRFCLAEGVVAQDMFYCIVSILTLMYFLLSVRMRAATARCYRCRFPAARRRTRCITWVSSANPSLRPVSTRSRRPIRRCGRRPWVTPACPDTYHRTRTSLTVTRRRRCWNLVTLRAPRRSERGSSGPRRGRVSECSDAGRRRQVLI